MKRILFLLIIITSTIMANGYSNEKDEFGFAIGGAIGYGLTYKHSLGNNLALRFTGGYFYDNNTRYNFGMELDYSLRKNKDMDFYFSLALLHTYEENRYYDYYYTEGSYNNYYEHDAEYDSRAAIGFGYSLYFRELFSLSLEFHQIFEYSVKTSDTWKNKTYLNIYPMVGMTVGFLF